MLGRRRHVMEVLSISALDIFASALGVFVLMAILMFPYYLRQPSLEVDVAGAEADLEASAAVMVHARDAYDEAMQQKADAEGELAAAKVRMSQAKAAAERAARTPEPEPEPAAPSPEEKLGEQDVRISIDDLDLVFVMDATGSMRSELADLQASLVGIIRVLHRLASSLRIGFVAFKDRTDAYLTRTFELRRMGVDEVRELVNFVRLLHAKGGGDDPEPVDQALEAAMAMPWRADAQGRIIVIGDAPPHGHNLRKTIGLAEAFRGSASSALRPRTVSAIFTGDKLHARAFYEQLAGAGGGDFSIHQGQIIEGILMSVLKNAKTSR